jgi:dsRNA-specific ribonuclease
MNNMSLDLDAVKNKIENVLKDIDPEWKIVNIHSFVDCFSSPQSSNYDAISFNRKVFFGRSIFEYHLKTWIYEIHFTKPLAEMKKMIHAYMHYTTLANLLDKMGLSSFVDFGNDGLKVYHLERNRFHVHASVLYALIVSLHEDSIRTNRDNDLKTFIRWLLCQRDLLQNFQSSTKFFEDSSYHCKLIQYFQKNFQKDPAFSIDQISDSLFEVTIYHHNKNSIGYAQGRHEELVIEEACLKACEYLHLV